MEGNTLSWQTITDDREKYKAYLCSREWALLRNAVRERCGGKCERCELNDMECVHHLTYARKYDEPIEDLAGWCNACHEFTHGKSDYDPAAQDTEGSWITKDHFLGFADHYAEGGESWKTITSALVCGIAVIEFMGLEWLQKAARGEFKPDDVEIAQLQAIIRNRRQEQGIS